MQVAVAGGTGRVGRHLVDVLRERTLQSASCHDLGMGDLRPLFTQSTAAEMHAALRLAPVSTPPGLRLDADSLGLLRDGLGRFDMEVRWVAHLDGGNQLRLWRSWTGQQIYQATIRESPDGTAAIEQLKVEQDPDRYRGRLQDEPRQFEMVLATVINTLRDFRAGHTPYGPTKGADPKPPPWPR